MKYLFSTAIILLLAGTSCNRCYTCNINGSTVNTTKVCKDDAMYDDAKWSAKDGGAFTDYDGRTLYVCH